MKNYNSDIDKSFQVNTIKQKNTNGGALLVEKTGRERVSFFVCAVLLAIMPNLSAFAADIPLYGVFETNIDYQALKGTAHPYADPFYGIELQANFTSPSGKKVTWWGFYDGNGNGGQSGNIWKVRFMPDELGAWTYTWQFADGSLSGAGSFQAVDNATNPKKPGPLRHDTEIHQWLVSADQSLHVFPNSYSHWGDGPVDLIYDNPTAAIAEVKAYGFSVLNTWSNMYWKDLPMNASNPMHFMDLSNYTPRLQGWHLLEKGLYKVAYEQNIYIYQWDGFYSGNSLYNLHTKSISFQNKVLKYWLAREAPYFMFLFNICFECGEFVSIPSWPVERANFVKSIDPWDHLISAHEDRAWSYGNSSVIDFSALQDDVNFHQRALQVWNSPTEPHPHCSECIWNAPWQAQGTETSHRQDLWNGITGGMSYLWATFAPAGNSFENTGRNAFKHANTFLKSGVKWWTMSPHDEIVNSGTAYALAKLGEEYVVYSSSGSIFNLSLPSGSYQYRWYDPTNGTFSALVNVNVSSGNNFSKPNGNDWVLHLAKTSGGDSIAPAPPKNLNAVEIPGT